MLAEFFGRVFSGVLVRCLGTIGGVKNSKVTVGLAHAIPVGWAVDYYGDNYSTLWQVSAYNHGPNAERMCSIGLQIDGLGHLPVMEFPSVLGVNDKFDYPFPGVLIRDALREGGFRGTKCRMWAEVTLASGRVLKSRVTTYTP